MKDDAPSATANIVAQNIILISNTPALSHLVAPEAARLSSWFVQAFSANGDKFIDRSREGWYQAVHKLYERLTISGLALHQALRKLHIEKLVREGLLDWLRSDIIWVADWTRCHSGCTRSFLWPISLNWIIR